MVEDNKDKERDGKQQQKQQKQRLQEKKIEKEEGMIMSGARNRFVFPSPSSRLGPQDR